MTSSSLPWEICVEKKENLNGYLKKIKLYVCVYIAIRVQSFRVLKNKRGLRQWKDQWLSEVGERRNEYAEHRIFRAVKPFYMILQWWIRVIHLCKPIEYIPPRVNPDINYGLWVIIMCQCRSIHCNCTFWWGTLIMEEGVYVCGGKARVYENSLLFLLSFAVNIILL